MYRVNVYKNNCDDAVMYNTVVFFGDSHDYMVFPLTKVCPGIDQSPHLYPWFIPTNGHDVDSMVRTIHQIWDNDIKSDELVFVCLSEKASEIFASYKYSDKVLYKNKIPENATTGCYMVWDNIGTLPQRIEELSSNVAFHGNF
jgi:hypothetical protein